MNHHTFHTEPGTQASFKLLQVTSDAFENESLISVKYTCDGANISPPLNIDHIPEEAQCLALIVDDPDAPVSPWTHWIAWNIPVTHHIKENEIHGTEGINDFGHAHYAGPCPPAGTHRYVFKVYALDKILDIPPQTRKHQLEKEISGHIIAFGELIGLYGSHKKGK
ncbi:MAG TPA: YbhB/YbcL family Raf kinase inhibitor-like protein [Agriterribacter sp.]|nr:YbhB/YbcL family Raf kinase inhibitor-like protein [Agriterribacter sp.]